MYRKLIAILLCLVISLSMALPAGARALITDISLVQSDAFTSLPDLADALDGVLAGDIDMYRDAMCSKEVYLPLGSSMSTGASYYVRSPLTQVTDSGWQCYIYANAVYNKLFGEPVARAGALKYSSVLLSGGNRLTYEMFVRAGVRTGAYIRTTTRSDGSYYGNDGHSFIVLSYDVEGITYLEGNANNRGLIRITMESWREFNNGELAGKGRWLCHLVQPTDAHYDSLYKDTRIYCSKGHSDNAWRVTRQPTQHSKGERALVCRQCGEQIKKEVLPVLLDVAKQFDDVSVNDWFYKNGALNFVYDKGLFKGLSDTTFAPQGAVERGMFVTVLGRLHGVEADNNVSTPFVDVPGGKYYTGYVAWAAKNDIVKGMAMACFYPRDEVTREQICTMMLRYCEYAKVDLHQQEEIEFTDQEQIAGWAKKAVAACQRGGIVSGIQNEDDTYRFDPSGKATRAQVATILMNFVNEYK